MQSQKIERGLWGEGRFSKDDWELEEGCGAVAGKGGIVEEMIERVKAAEDEIAFETARSGNSSGYETRRFAFHEELTNEWAKRLFAAYVTPGKNRRQDQGCVI